MRARHAVELAHEIVHAVERRDVRRDLLRRNVRDEEKMLRLVELAAGKSDTTSIAISRDFFSAAACSSSVSFSGHGSTSRSLSRSSHLARAASFLVCAAVFLAGLRGSGRLFCRRALR